ncbi:MAG TPA: Uma2 family endonuclease [Candidatus Elarobacter sp.]|nr:Uma2 family endonuclease [Candidatus Elarobacter sp.]HEV2740693.1 Uma2 family endonuclease [Candidatus Elarobacter sp.]
MIVPARPLDDDELLRFSAKNPGWHIEREPDGSLSVSPTSYRNGIRAFEAARQLFAWGGDRGYAAASDGGITLPDKAVRAPDASWISFERWHALSEKQRKKFPKVIPDVVIEIVSQYDSYAAQRRKTERYVQQGAVYGVVIDPERRKVEEFGTRPEGLALDFDRIIGAG